MAADRWDAEAGERIWVGSGEYMTPQDAKLAARTWLPEGADVFTIQRGTYTEDRIPDDEYGTVLGPEKWDGEERDAVALVRFVLHQIADGDR